jgi:hypothetical protein
MWTLHVLPTRLLLPLESFLLNHYLSTADEWVQEKEALDKELETCRAKVTASEAGTK